MSVSVELSIGSKVEQFARCVVGSGCECVAVGEEPTCQLCHCWRGMTYWTALMSDSWPVKVWTALPVRISQTLAVASQAPETKRLALGAREILPNQLMCLSPEQASSPHNIPSMIVKLLSPDALLDIPKHTRHVSRTSNDPPIIDKSTSRQVPRMSTKFSSKFDLPARSSRSSASNRVDGTDVVQSTTSDKVAAWRVCTSHDPT